MFVDLRSRRRLTERCVELLDITAAGLLPCDHRGGLKPTAATNPPTEAVGVPDPERRGPLC